MSDLAENSVVNTTLERKRKQKMKQQQAEEARKQKELEEAIPTPIGFRLLIALPTVEETFGESGIVKSGKTVFEETVLATLGLVLDMGADAYTDKTRYPNGPWCKVGDYVLFRPNSGTRFRIGNQEYRILNEDSIDAIVPKPRAISRA